jgi:hypothetical protein
MWGVGFFKERKKILILVGIVAAVLIIPYTVLAINKGSFNIFSGASSSALTAKITNSRDPNFLALTQLDTYLIDVTGPGGAKLKGPFTNVVEYCPLGVARNGTGCKKYEVNFVRYTLVDGTIKGDLGELAQTKPSDIGDYYMAFRDGASGKISNTVLIRVNKIDMTTVWTMNPNDFYVYEGENLLIKDAAGNSRKGTIYSDYVKKDKVCSQDENDSVAWRVAGSTPYMYWNPLLNPNQTSPMDLAKHAPELQKYYNAEEMKTAHTYLSWNFSRMHYSSDKSPENEYFGNQYSYYYNSKPSVDRNMSNYTPEIDKAFSYVNQVNWSYPIENTKKNTISTSTTDASHQYYPNGNLLYFPRMLDLNWVYQNEVSHWYNYESNSDDVCKTLYGETAGDATHKPYKIMHNVSYYAKKESDGKYSVVTSLKEIYSGGQCTTMADYVAGKCPRVLREDYIAKPGVGLIGLVTDNYGPSVQLANNPECKTDSDCMIDPVTKRSKQPIQNPNFRMTLVKKGQKTAPGTPVTAARTIVGSNTAQFTFTVDTKLVSPTDLESFQIVVDPKGGYAPTCGTNFSYQSHGGLRLMLNSQAWKLGNNMLSITGNQAGMYLYNPNSTVYTNGYNSSSNAGAAGSYGWSAIAPNATEVRTNSGFKVTNLNYKKDSSGKWTVTMNVIFPPGQNITTYNAYFAYQKTGVKQLGNQLINVPELNISDCKGVLFNKITFVGETQVPVPTTSPTAIVTTAPTAVVTAAPTAAPTATVAPTATTIPTTSRIPNFSFENGLTSWKVESTNMQLYKNSSFGARQGATYFETNVSAAAKQGGKNSLYQDVNIPLKRAGSYTFTIATRSPTGTAPISGRQAVWGIDSRGVFALICLNPFTLSNNAWVDQKCTFSPSVDYTSVRVQVYIDTVDKNYDFDAAYLTGTGL